MITNTLSELDSRLHQCVSGIDILTAIAPVNFREQKDAFFQSLFSRNPEFVYRENVIDLFQRKRELYNLPVDKLQDDDLVYLYSGVIESYIDKLDQFKSINSTDFLYDSMRYFGEPNDKDIRNAHFLLHLPALSDASEAPARNARAIASALEAFARAQGYEYSLQIDDSMIAKAMVSGTTVKVNSSASANETEIQALAHHELGVHLVTTLNGRAQPLKVLSLGCPVNTTSQEGLAILCEYLAGFMSLSRLKNLALRVLAVQSMINERDFKKTFLLLKEEHGVEEDAAFTITARVYRGGGFSKDYLYLRGFHEILNAFETRSDFRNLLCGKVSLDYLGVVTRLIEKQVFREPLYISPAINAPADIDQVQRFIAHAIK